MRLGISTYFSIHDRDLNEISQTYGNYRCCREIIVKRTKNRRPPGKLLKTEFGYIYQVECPEGIPEIQLYFVRRQLTRDKQGKESRA